MSEATDTPPISVTVPEGATVAFTVQMPKKELPKDGETFVKGFIRPLGDD